MNEYGSFLSIFVFEQQKSITANDLQEKEGIFSKTANQKMCVHKVVKLGRIGISTF